MKQAEIDKQSITYLINKAQSPDEARHKIDRLEGISLPKKYVRAIVEDAIKQKFFRVVESPRTAKLLRTIEAIEKKLS